MAMNEYQDGGADSEQVKNNPLRPADQNAADMGTYEDTGSDIIDLNRNPNKPPFSNPKSGIGDYQMTGADEVPLSKGGPGTWPWENQAKGVTKPL